MPKAELLRLLDKCLQVTIWVHLYQEDVASRGFNVNIDKALAVKRVSNEADEDAGGNAIMYQARYDKVTGVLYLAGIPNR